MTRLSLFTVLCACFCASMGCSQGTTSRCPADFPVERDGFCYAADGGAMLDAGSTTDTGGSPDDDGGGGGVDTGPGLDVGPIDAAVICVGEHPIVMGTRRYCNPGDCFCADPDACYPMDVASACCTVPVVCEGTDGGAGGTDAGPAADAPSVICVGEHPNFTGMGTLRWCNPGNCYCSDVDTCYPMDVADACCAVTLVCY